MPKYSPKFQWSAPIHVRIALCEGCSWSRDGAGLADVRAHVERTGHSVQVDAITRTVIGVRVQLAMELADVS